MIVRKAAAGDLDRIMKIYAYARAFMADTGNPNQWTDGYPQRELVEKDTAQGVCYVCVDDEGTVQGVFTFIIGLDPTYGTIEDGAWLDDEAEYGTIHRIAGAEGATGIMSACMDFCSRQISNLRIDTHVDNRIMRHNIEKYGFSYCGIIYSVTGGPRIAYQRIQKL